MSNTSTSAELSEENYCATTRVGSVRCYVTPSFTRIGEDALGWEKKKERQFVAVQFMSLSMEPWSNALLLCYFNFKLACGRCDLY